MATKKIRKSTVKLDLSTEFEQWKSGTYLRKGKKYKNKYYIEEYNDGTLSSTSWHKGNDLSLMSCIDINIEGPFEEYYENGNLHRKGNKNKDKYYIETYGENGTLMSRTSHRCGKDNPFITCEDMNLDGPFEYYYENGQISEKGTKKNDELHGLHKQYYGNGQLWYEERYSNGKRNGNYVNFHPNGQVSYRGNYCEDKKTGLHRSWDSEGNLVFRGRYVDDVPNGKEQSFDKEGKPLEGIIENYYEDGTPYFKGNFINGRADGLHKYWYKVRGSEKRYTSEIMYKNGKLDGEWVFTQGSSKNIKIYKEGVLISEEEKKIK